MLLSSERSFQVTGQGAERAHKYAGKNSGPPELCSSLPVDVAQVQPLQVLMFKL